MISILHIGLPLVQPWLTPDECETIAARLAAIQQKMKAAGYRYVVMHASPDGGLTKFRERLRTEAGDAVLIGGGVAADPKLATFQQQIIDAIRDEAPRDQGVGVRSRVGCADFGGAGVWYFVDAISSDDLAHDPFLRGRFSVRLEGARMAGGCGGNHTMVVYVQT